MEIVGEGEEQCLVPSHIQNCEAGEFSLMVSTFYFL